MEEVFARPSPSAEAPGLLLGQDELAVPRGADADGAGKPRSRWDGFKVAAGRASGHLASWERFDLFLVVALVALSLGLRWRTLWANYWGDEAIAIGIAAQPLRSLPHALVNDGSPPLYYVALHFWMRVFGRSELATHALSMIGALLAIPAAWWCGAKLFGRWAARGAAALVATCAYLDYYSTETRMYSWLVLAAVLAVACFVLAYRGAGRRYWVAAVVLMSAVLYLQYYGFYLFGAVVLVGSAAALRERSRLRFKATLYYALACAVAFAPWVPQFAYQLFNTGAPWAPHPSPADFFGDSFNALASAAWAAIVVAIAACVLARRNATGEPLAANGRAPSALAMVTAVPLLTLVLAWVGGQFVNSWNPRYLGIAAVPVLVPLAGGLARVRRGLLVLCGTVVALVATAVPMLVDRTTTVETSKSDAAYLLARLRPLLRPGDLVISAQVTDAPVVALYLGRGFRYATPFGLLKHPLVVDWADLPARLQSTNAASNLAPLLAALPVGGHVLLVNPNTWSRGETPQRYAGEVEAEAIAANLAVLNDPALQVEKTESVPQYANPLYPINATLLVKAAQ
jgi:4-amino-4-deoxy-L-arabinose transferase-like glycosyltransferase